MEVPPTAMVATGTCVGLFLSGYNMFESDERPDLAGALYMFLVALLADRMRISARVFNRVWMFAIAVVVYYVVSQVAMFYVWLPFWARAESAVDWTCESGLVYKVYERFPRAVVFARRHWLPTFKLVLMLFATYQVLVLGPVCSDLPGIHDNALVGLLDARSPRTRTRRARRATSRESSRGRRRYKD